jgi:hypothetical protein
MDRQLLYRIQEALSREFSARIQKTLEIIHQLYRHEIIADYVVVGSIGAMFYVEPFNTQDIDFIVPLSLHIDALSPLHTYLR